MTSLQTRPRKAFTLVELLVVITIIGILAALLTVAVGAAIRWARTAAIRWELNQLSMALEEYKNKYGEYPPDFTNIDDVVNHVKLRWPHYIPGQAKGDTSNTYAVRLFDDLDLASRRFIDPKNPGSATAYWSLNPGNNGTNDYAKLAALAFWMGGFPDKSNIEASTLNFYSSARLGGFSANPRDPFFLTVNSDKKCDEDGDDEREDMLNLAKRENTFYPFEPENWYHQPIPASSTGNREPRAPMILVKGKPVAYFRGTSSDTAKALRRAYLNDYGDNAKYDWTVPYISYADYGVAVPYAKSGELSFDSGSTPRTDDLAGDVQWHNPRTFQLIHPGLDGQFNGNDASVVTSSRVDDNFVSTSGDKAKNVTPLDFDNVVNLGETATVESLLED